MYNPTQEWLEATPENNMFTNAELLQMPEDSIWRQLDWINPFDLDALAVKRNELKYRPLKYRQWLEQEFTGLPAKLIKEQVAIRKDEQRREDIARCGEKHYRKSATKVGTTNMTVWYCNQKDCPHCRDKRLEKLSDRIRSCGQGSHVMMLSRERADEIKAGLTKNDYEQINDEATGTVYLIVKDASQFNEEYQPLGYGMASSLAEIALSCDKKRISGNLSKTTVAAVPVKEVEEKEEPSKKMEVRRRAYTAKFKADGEIKNHRQLDEIIIKELPADIELTTDNLQYIIYQLEQITERLAQVHCEEFHFMRSETIIINIDDIDWSYIENSRSS